MSLGRKWAASRQNLWNEFNDPTKTRDKIISNVSIGIEKDQWAHFDYCILSIVNYLIAK